MGQVTNAMGHTYRIHSFVFGWVAKTKSTQQPATRKPAPAHIAIRLPMELLLSAAEDDTPNLSQS